MRRPAQKERLRPKSGSLQDLKPNAVIHCMYCNQSRPKAGSQKFCAHDICRECTSKLQAIKA